MYMLHMGVGPVRRWQDDDRNDTDRLNNGRANDSVNSGVDVDDTWSFRSRSLKNQRHSKIAVEVRSAHAWKLIVTRQSVRVDRCSLGTRGRSGSTDHGAAKVTSERCLTLGRHLTRASQKYSGDNRSCNKLATKDERLKRDMYMIPSESCT